MRVGIYLSNQQHLTTDMVQALDGQIALVRAARDAGWDSLFSGQHFLNEGNNQQLEIVPFLARMMAETGDMRVGTGVFLLPLHNPVYVAETVATLDVISGGRFVFGLGLGYRGIEFDAFGVRTGSRVRRLEETLEVAKQLWSGETVSYESEYCRLNAVTLNLRPVQRPHPPLWFGGSAAGAIRRAARLGDTWFISPGADLDTVRGQLKIYRGELAAQGRSEPDELPIFREICVAESQAAAFDRAREWLLGKYADYARWGSESGAKELNLEDLARERFFIGTPEQCLEQMRHCCDATRATHFVLRPHWAGMPVPDALASMKLISQELLPELRKW